MLDELLGFHDKLTVCAGAVVPVPVKASVIDDGTPLLTKVSVALAVPIVCGLNVTLNAALCPAWIVMGSEIPLRSNRELLLLAAVMVTFAPLAVRLSAAVPLAPTATLPKFKAVGVTANCPSAVVPVPVRSPTMEEGFALLTKVKVPLAAPLVCGLKVTVNSAL